MLKVIKECIEKVKGSDVVIYDMEQTSPLFDYMVIATVDSERQSDAACEYIKTELESKGYQVKNIEGKYTAWVLIDCIDVIVHVFTKQEREYYNLEKIYLDVKKVDYNAI